MIFNKKVNLAEKIYQNIVKISRSKFFYIDLNLDDSFETRFDLIIAHSFIIFYFYKINSNQQSNISQNLFDYMFNDFENNLREMGFGDIAVNKKMKLFIRAFYGRLAQYNKGIEIKREKGDKSLLEQAIINNIFKGNIKKKNNIDWFVDYMSNNLEYFLNKSEKENLETSFKFLKIK
tara:strand:+ start:1237 stop:1767 length:531 start_codon:yes stop_codon:yes gene_type:complete